MTINTSDFSSVKFMVSFADDNTRIAICKEDFDKLSPSETELFWGAMLVLSLSKTGIDAGRFVERAINNS